MKEVITGRRYKIIINEPVVVYILTTRYGTFKGKAKCHPNDFFIKDEGIKIAYNRAKRKELDYRLRLNGEDIIMIEEILEELYKLEEKILDKYQYLI